MQYHADKQSLLFLLYKKVVDFIMQPFLSLMPVFLY